jgi:Domain of unknown function (DUF222)
LGVAKRVAAMSAELDELLAEPLEMLSTAERLTLAYQWETQTRRRAAMGHWLVVALAEAPVAELGAPTAASALETLLRITKDEAGGRVREAGELAGAAAAARLARLLDEDGQLSEADGARRRYLSLGRQQSDGMRLLDPEGRAVFDAVLAKLAANGMCNPDDESPCVDGPAPDRRPVRLPGWAGDRAVGDPPRSSSRPVRRLGGGRLQPKTRSGPGHHRRSSAAI